MKSEVQLHITLKFLTMAKQDFRKKVFANKWTEDEESILKASLMKGKSFDQIHDQDLGKRTVKAIKYRAMMIAKNEINATEAKTEKVLDKYGLDATEYKTYLREMEKQKDAKNDRAETLTLLRNRVDKLEERIAKLEASK